MSIKMKNDKADRSTLSGVYQPFYVVHPFSQGIGKAGAGSIGDEISKSVDAVLAGLLELFIFAPQNLKAAAVWNCLRCAVVSAEGNAYYAGSLMGCAEAR